MDHQAVLWPFVVAAAPGFIDVNAYKDPSHLLYVCLTLGYLGLGAVFDSWFLLDTLT
jgi:hypothetical protein